MTEDKNIRNNIRKAVRSEEVGRPQMPKDLNARLMKRVEKEVNSKPKRPVVLWPWIAAACVAAIIVVLIAPPKQTISDEANIAQVDSATTKKQSEIIKQEDAPQRLIAKDEAMVQEDTKTRNSSTSTKTRLIAKAGNATETKTEEPEKIEVPSTAECDLAAMEKPTAKPKPRVTSDRDLPITRPENLKYTKEELALLKKQANEAYLKWAELELEIAKYNQEQTAAN